MGKVCLNACITSTNSGSSYPFQGDEGGAQFNKELPLLIYFELIDHEGTEQELAVHVCQYLPPPHLDRML